MQRDVPTKWNCIPNWTIICLPTLELRSFQFDHLGVNPKSKTLWRSDPELIMTGFANKCLATDTLLFQNPAMSKNRFAPKCLTRTVSPQKIEGAEPCSTRNIFLSSTTTTVRRKSWLMPSVSLRPIYRGRLVALRRQIQFHLKNHVSGQSVIVVLNQSLGEIRRSMGQIYGGTGLACHGVREG